MTKSRAGLSPNLSLRAELRKPAVRSQGGIVVSQHRLASEIGAHVLADGGHAVDAAVATSFAVGVLEPWMNGVGGIGAMLVRSDDKIAALEFGARSPAALDPADYPIVPGEASDLFDWPRVKDDRNLIGPKAVVAPRLVAGMAAAHRRYGRKPWRDLVAPAAAIAAEGMVVDWHTLLMLATAHGQLARDPGCAAVFLPGGTLPVPPPAVAPNPVIRLPNPALARTLEAIADDADAFYRGPVARALTDDVRAAGGVLAPQDMAAVEARAVAPVTYRHRGRTIYALPELTGGPTLLDAFAGLDRRWGGGALDGAAFTAMAASLRDAWDKRFATMGDTAQTAAGSSTTHLSVVDRDGNMVALTQTLLSLFGARFLSPSTGILLNNGINWFDPRPGRPNSIGANKRTLSNYCPAIMLGTDDAAAIGGCGGRKILPAVFQLLVMMANGSPLDEAFHAPRIDVSGGDTVVVDRDLPVDVRAALAGAFKALEVERTTYPAHFTIASGVRRVGGMNEGATEPHHPWSEAVAEE